MIDALFQCVLTVGNKSEVVPSCHGIQPRSMAISSSISESFLDTKGTPSCGLLSLSSAGRGLGRSHPSRCFVAGKSRPYRWMRSPRPHLPGPGALGWGRMGSEWGFHSFPPRRARGKRIAARTVMGRKSPKVSLMPVGAKQARKKKKEESEKEKRQKKRKKESNNSIYIIFKKNTHRDKKKEKRKPRGARYPGSQKR